MSDPNPNLLGEPASHPRDAVMQAAQTEFVAYAREFSVRHALTAIEWLHLLVVLLLAQANGLFVQDRAAQDHKAQTEADGG